MKIIGKETLPKEVEVGGWKISAESGIVSSPQGKSLILEPRLSKLIYLLSLDVNAIVSRSFLTENIWRDTIVNDDSLTRAIADLRKALLKHFNNTVRIETVPKRGYKLTFTEDHKVHVLKIKLHKPIHYVMLGTALLLLILMWYFVF